MNVSQYTTKFLLTSWVGIDQAIASDKNIKLLPQLENKTKLDMLQPLRQWVNKIDIGDRIFAHRLCKLIPAQCPFERELKLFGRTLYIPPMCKLNPLYEEVVSLRFRALCYLADECGEDITSYC
ncbi:Mo-dependent nitrogenase C-terminal domain-containing protein [Gloeocapsopsis dulcis]|uniref:Nitrogenase n=1 Tax=Gloeocapsopsis dulcis AAB1 = 1H9 TaxID=1433147 RepID=A0A6N8G2E9_9CHRO|nr:Mo-dependent nitrogenase C-terminal domain-containing protein [Gloeocapsopsis dulcis]MUL38356.1 nitrogenase [Gloeocapsopsis dulcis AAB1 = 1H9]WNN91599.1 Mo-dependent nitrogenase C-terminal domain-containing protein [Gloeocapsopsis dulcis]